MGDKKRGDVTTTTVARAQDDMFFKKAVTNGPVNETEKRSGKMEQAKQSVLRTNEDKTLLNSAGEPKISNKKVRIDAIPDLLKENLDKQEPKDVGVHLSFASNEDVSTISWELYGPGNELIHAFGNVSPDKKFYLYDADFIKAHEKKLVEGRYVLQCKVHDSRGMAHAMGVRNFNIWEKDSPAPEAKLGKFKIDYEIPAPETGRLVHVRIEFMPHANKVRSAKIGFIQNVRILNSAGKVISPDSQSSRSERITPADWAIDRSQGKRSPYFGTDIGTNQKIIDESARIQLGKGGPNPVPAYMEDRPSTPGVLSFEACAVGMDTGEVFGCVTWGYSTLPDGKVSLMPRGFRDKPSAEFAEASAKWNAWITNSGKAGEKIMLK